VRNALHTSSWRVMASFTPRDPVVMKVAFLMLNAIANYKSQKPARPRAPACDNSPNR
jgi:hypothetical protein